jgi:hypothetical protein
LWWIESVRPQKDGAMAPACVRKSKFRDATAAFCLLAIFAVPGCAEFAEWISIDEGPRKAAAASEAESAQLWEMTLMAGRYGVMLGQAREILRLPEPKAPAGDTFPGDSPSEVQRRQALAAFQAGVAAEFAADVNAACKRRRVPHKLKALACEQRAKLPAELHTPTDPDMLALALRNDHVGQFVMPWWNAVCASAPKPRKGEVRVCAIE